MQDERTDAVLPYEDWTSFGEMISRKRRALGLTQADLAARVGCATVTIKKIEQEERKPSRPMALLLAKYLAVPEAAREGFLEMARGGFIPALKTTPEGLAVPPFLLPGAPAQQKITGHFVERQAELGRLGTCVDRALAGHGMPVFILGDAGSGKTSLMAEFARRAQAAAPQLLVAGGQCNAQTGAGDPYRPFRDILGMLTGDLESYSIAGGFSREHALRLWTAIPDTLQALAEFGPNLLNVLLPLPPLVSRIAPYLTGSMEGFERLQTSARSRAALEQDQVLEELTQVLSRVAARHPLVLLLDDLQWVDDASLNVLFHLGRRLVHSRILLVGAFRPGESRTMRGQGPAEPAGLHPIETLVLELAREYGDIQIDLNRSGSSAGRAFVDALLDREPNRLEAAFRDALYRHTLGQPLFTVEMLRSMQESGRLVRDREGKWVESKAPLPEPLPARVEAVIEQRLRRLKPAQLELLSAASVQGEQFTAELAAGMLGLEPREALRSLSGELSQQHRLVQEQGEAQPGAQRITRFQFRHLLFQEYVYGRLSPGEKKRLHRAAAVGLETLGFGAGGGQPWDEVLRAAMLAEGGLEPARLDVLEKIGPELVHHFQLGENWQQAAGYAFLMGQQARQRYAMREAMAYFELARLALAQLAEPPDEFIYQILMGWEEAAFKFKPYQEQLSQLARAEQIARRRNDKPALIQALHWTANVYLARGLWTRAGPALMESLALAAELDSEPLSVRPIYYKGLMTSFFNPPDALAPIERALRLAQKYGDVHIEALALGTKGQVQAQLGDFAGSQQSIAQARQAAARLGSPLTESDVDLLAAWACLAMGETEQGLTYGQRSVQRAIDTDNMDCLCSGLACVGYGNLELQRVSQAVTAFEKGIARSEISGAIIPKLNGQAGLAMAQFFSGRAEAVQDLENVVEQMHLYENEVGAANANLMLGRCYLQLGAFERAEMHLDAAIAYYRRAQMNPFLERALNSREELMKKL